MWQKIKSQDNLNKPEIKKQPSFKDCITEDQLKQLKGGKK